VSFQVYFFGELVDVCGVAEFVYSGSVPCTVKQFKEELLDEFPALSHHKFSVASEHSYRNEEDMLESGMEVALIPPVGGG
jgi:molybdopterin converting factor small subunit